MKIDERSRSQLIVAVALMTLVSTGTSVYSWSRGPSRRKGVEVDAAPSSSAPNRNLKVTRQSNVDPRLRYGRLGLIEARRYIGNGRNIFLSLSNPEPQLPKKGPSPAPNPGPPRLKQATPTAIPLRFYGYTTTVKSPYKVFLRQDDAIFVASEGETFDRRYKITRIEAGKVDIEDLLEKRVQTFTLQHD